MRRKRSIIVILVLLAVLLAMLPGLVGCGEEESQAQEVVIGFLGDATGYAAFALLQIQHGLEDYIHMAKDKNMLPEWTTIKLVSYDTRGETGRAPTGYQWLRGQGAQLVVVPFGTHLEVLKERAKGDGILLFGMQGAMPLLGVEGVFVLNPPAECPVEALMKWVVDNWDYDL